MSGEKGIFSDLLLGPSLPEMKGSSTRVNHVAAAIDARKNGARPGRVEDCDLARLPAVRRIFISAVAVGFPVLSTVARSAAPPAATAPVVQGRHMRLFVTVGGSRLHRSLCCQRFCAVNKG